MNTLNNILMSLCIVLALTNALSIWLACACVALLRTHDAQRVPQWPAWFRRYFTR
jgi:hypothetical protein